ncbi:MAG: hypothetical protein GXN96_06670 [Aquificae bacterium]|nr:hypothetical protein [Aquificota bacterium]
MKNLLLSVVLLSLSFGAMGELLNEVNGYIKELKRAGSPERTPYLYGKVLGYYEGMKVYASVGKERGTEVAFSYLREEAEKAVRSTYADREPATELVVFVPRVRYVEHCDGILGECFYEKEVEKEEYLKLVNYEALVKRIEYLRENGAKKCAPEVYGKSEALFNLISLELMREKPDREALLLLRDRLTFPLIEAEEMLRYAMNNDLECIR